MPQGLQRSQGIHPISRAGMAARPCESGAWRMDNRSQGDLWKPKAEELFLCFWTRALRALSGRRERSEHRAAGGEAAPTSESPEPPHGPKPTAHHRAPVGHRWQPDISPATLQQSARLSGWDEVRYSGKLISPGQEMPPRYRLERR